MTHLIAHHPVLFEPGDRLSRQEFLARWEQMPALKKAELIDGVVYMPSPVSKGHGRFDAIVQMLLNVYAARTPGCESLSNATWLMMDSAPQPDACLYRVAAAQAGTDQDLAAGSPELSWKSPYPADPMTWVLNWLYISERRSQNILLS